jgi:hypothetical protein
MFLYVGNLQTPFVNETPGSLYPLPPVEPTTKIDFPAVNHEDEYVPLFEPLVKTNHSS